VAPPVSGRLDAAEAVLQQVVQIVLGPVLVLVEDVHKLRGEDLLRAGVHLLLAGGEALLHLADRQVANHFGQFVHVSRLDLLAVVLEATVPVLGHLGNVVGENRDHLLHLLLVDHAPQTGDTRVLAGHHHGHAVVEDLDREVVAFLPEQRLRFLLQHHSGAVMRIDDLVADLVITHRCFDLEIGFERFVYVNCLYYFGNWWLLS
jgi:hypothetical protein